MSEALKKNIINYLQDSDLQVAPNLELPELVDVLIDRANDAELDYAILSYAYSNSVPVESYENFYEEVLTQLEAIAESEASVDEIMDKIAAKFAN